MEVQLRVYRQDPETSPTPRYDHYQVDVPEFATVLDALLQVREYQDGTLALRCSCRSAICGSCAMRIDGYTRLACKTRIGQLAGRQPILIEPMQQMPVIKDLVVDMTMFWDKVQAVEPWLQPEGEPPEREYPVADERMLDLAGAMNCIMCGACVSECTVMTVDKSFLGPAALAKAYRFVGDPRDAAAPERLSRLNGPGGMWDCVHCFQCVQACPKDVAPMERILQLREEAMKQGVARHNGAKHAQAFTDIIRHSGRLDETSLILRSVSPLELIGMTATAVRALLHGKAPLPAPLHRPIPRIDEVRRIYDRLEKRGEKKE